MKYFFRILLTLIASSNVYSASYSCSLDGLSSTEKMICDTPNISELDEQLNEWYTLLRQTDSGYLFRYIYPSLKPSQREWISSRNDCSNINCLRDSYEGRLSKLKSEYLNYRKYTSTSFIERILRKAAGEPGQKNLELNELISFTLNSNGIGQYLLSSYQGYDGNPNGHCGGGAYYGFWFIEVNTIDGSIIKKDSEVYGNCGANIAYLTYTIESDSPLKVTMFVERSFEDEPKEYFSYTIGYEGNNRFYRLVGE